MADSPDSFANPISAAFRVLEEYRGLLDAALEEQSGLLSGEDRERVVESMEVDRGLIFSKTNTPEPGSPVEKVINDVGYHSDLIDLLDHHLQGNPFYRHQEEAIRAISGEADDTRHTVVATGTGSGKTESFLVPVFNECLQRKSENGVKALLLYPMNALANDQMRRITDWAYQLEDEGHRVTYGAYVGSTDKTIQDKEKREEKRRGPGHLVTRREMRENPPDILLTNYVMLDYMLTRGRDRKLFEQSADSLAYLVLDEIHTYQGTKATDLMHLLRRFQERLHTEPMKVATSATLMPPGEERQGAYTRGTKEDLDAYIKPLLGIDDFNYFTLDPVEEEKPDLVENGTNEGAEQLTEIEELDWLLTTDKEQNISLIEKVTGTSIPTPRLFAWEAKKVYDQLDENRFVNAMREALERRARSFQDLVELLRNTYDLGPEHDAESIVRGFLSLISYFNRFGAQDRDEQLLDFRMNLFVRDLDGRLKTCLHCNQYHSGRQNRCPACGNPLFLTYGCDVSKCIARVTDRSLSYELRPGSDEEKESIYVLLSASSGDETTGKELKEDDPSESSPSSESDNKSTESKEASPNIPSIDIEEPQFYDDTAELNYADEGHYQVELLDGVTDADQAYEQTVRLHDPYRDFDYLHRLSESLLEYNNDRSEENGKLLGFVDSRERVSRYGMGLRDAFADQYLAEKLVNQQVDPRPLPAIASLVDAWIPENDEDEEDIEAAVRREAMVWFGRWVGRASKSETKILSLDPDLDVPEVDRMVLETLFLESGSIYRGPSDNSQTDPHYAFYEAHEEDVPDTSHITLHKHAAVRRQGIYLEEGASSPHPHYSGLALTENARRFREEIEEYGLDTLRTSVRNMVESSDPNRALQKDSILIAREVPGVDEEPHFYLNPRYVQFHPEAVLKASRVERGNGELVYTPVLRTADSHSSSRSSKERKRIEARFSGESDDKKLDVLMATPTLELGVDIGELRTVLMVGVPPMPSNYAQRAGRAGRDAEDGQALIVAMCSGSREHDNYYFENPRRMVNGWVTPPAFNETATPVAKKHLHAWMLEGHAGEQEHLRRFIQHLSDNIDEQREAASILFGKCMDVEGYLDQQFRNVLGDVLEEIPDEGAPQHALYTSDFFPDYNFRRDEIPLVEAGTVREPEPVDDVRENTIETRPPEEAYYKYAPQSTVYAAGKVYRVGVEAPHDIILVEDTGARSFEYFPALRNEHDTSPYETRETFDRSEVFETDGDGAEVWGDLIQFGYHPNLEIGFRNDGPLRPDHTDPFVNDGQTFSVGYQLTRNAIRISIDKLVCREESVEISLAFALDRALKREFNLGEGEIRMLAHPDWHDPDAENLEGPEEVAPSRLRHIILYDGDGNENVPFDRVREKVKSEDWLRHVYQRIEDCECDNGCYLCMRSHNTQYHAEALEKEKGVMALKYLAGDGEMITEPEPQQETEGRPDLVVKVDDRRNSFVTTTNRSDEEFRRETKDGHNTALFDSITLAVLHEWSPDMRHLHVQSSTPHVVGAISDHEVSKGKDAFSRLLFALLRFQRVTAEEYG